MAHLFTLYYCFKWLRQPVEMLCIWLLFVKFLYRFVYSCLCDTSYGVGCSLLISWLIWPAVVFHLQQEVRSHETVPSLVPSIFSYTIHPTFVPVFRFCEAFFVQQLFFIPSPPSLLFFLLRICPPFHLTGLMQLWETLYFSWFSWYDNSQYTPVILNMYKSHKYHVSSIRLSTSTTEKCLWSGNRTRVSIMWYESINQKCLCYNLCTNIYVSFKYPCSLYILYDCLYRCLYQAETVLLLRCLKQ